MRFLILMWFVLLIAVGIVTGETSFLDFIKLKKSEKVLADAVFNLVGENERLKEEIKKLKASPRYARKVLKDKYHVLEPNEEMMFFVE